MSRRTPIFCDGFNRRNFLQIGSMAMGGVTLPQLLQAQGENGGRLGHKANIMVFLAGGPPHLDMFDMKPDAPEEIRGEFSPISTSVPGFHICEHLPLLAARAHKYFCLRSLCTSNAAGRADKLSALPRLELQRDHQPLRCYTRHRSSQLSKSSCTLPKARRKCHVIIHIDIQSGIGFPRWIRRNCSQAVRPM